MTTPITRFHVIGGALVRYTKVPAALPDPGAPPPPPPPPGTTIYGYNWNNTDAAQQTIAGRLAKFSNRNPCPRVYTGATGHPSTFTVSTATATEKRVCWSFKAGGGDTETFLASTSAVARYVSWLEDIPADWEVFWCYHHEPNSSGGMEVDPTNFVNTYTRMAAAKAAASLASGVQVHITANFMDYQVDTANWSDSWVPQDAEILTWDMYGNPGQNTASSGTNKYGTATGSAYGSTYPLVDVRTESMFAVTERTGFADSWGILELNTPLRNWDLNESARVAWHTDVLNYFQAPPMTGRVPPKICLLWEAPSGANWNQAYGYNTPQGTNTGSADNSPMWGVWRPYITGTPVGG